MSIDNYRKELVQVAAVCLAAAQCRRLDTTALDGNTQEGARGWLEMNGLSMLVHKERHAQELKWGTRTGKEAPPEFWLAVLMEEVGEVAGEVLNDRLMDADYYRLTLAIENVGNEARAILEERAKS